MSIAAQLHLQLPTPQPGAEGGDSLPDRLCALLVRRGRPLEVGHIAAQLLRLRGCPERLQRLLVAEIVEGDARLAWLGRDLVGLAPPDWFGASLAGATFCIVDLETTGGAPGHSKVTEIGAVRLTGLAIQERFSTLVNPGRPIPPVVTGLTGIDDGMVAQSPDIEAALSEFVAFAGQDVLVAHNAPFDLRFLNYERRRLWGRYFTQPWLDTLVLARRLLNGQVARHDLGSLSVWADTVVRPTHRALPDAEATAEVLVRLIGMLEDRGIDTLERAVHFGGLGGARHAYKLALAEDLPTCPGVYVMRDRDGKALYVGKAGNLRRRVRSYFGPGGRHGRLIGRALEQLESIEHETCGSEFAALLREDALIKSLRPPCNRRGTSGPGHFLKLNASARRPRLYAVPRVRRDGAAYFGPLRSARLTREAIACLTELYPINDPDPDARAQALSRLDAVLRGDPRAIGELGVLLGAGMAAGAVAIDDGDGVAPAHAVLATLAALARARRAATTTAVLVERGEADGAAEIFFIGGGVVRHSAMVDAQQWEGPARQGLEVLARQIPGSLAADAMEQAGIIAERIRLLRVTGSAMELGAGWEVPAVLERIGAAVRAVVELDPPEPDPELADG